MRTNASTARLPNDHTGARSAVEAEAIRKIRPIEARLTGEDARRLQEHLGRCEDIGSGVYVLLGEFIRAKLADAVLVGPDEIDPDLATGYSQVVYAVGGGALQSKVLSHRDYVGTGQFVLSIRSLLGATLLGMKAGQCAPLLRADGTAGTVELHEVLCQPEPRARDRAVWRHEQSTKERTERSRRPRTAPDSLHRAGRGAFRRLVVAAEAPPPGRPDDERNGPDPGPSTA